MNMSIKQTIILFSVITINAMDQKNLFEKNHILNLYQNDFYLPTRVSVYQYLKAPQTLWDWAWQLFPITKSETILELGSGLGTFWHNNRNKVPHNCSITLTDIASTMLEMCKNHTQSLQEKCNMTYEIADVEKLQYGNNKFDRVACHFVLYYTQDPLCALKEIYRVLKPGGTATIFLLHSDSNKKLYELAHEVDQRFPVKDILLERCCEENAEAMIKSIFEEYKKYDYEHDVVIPHNANLTSFFRSIAQTYKIAINSELEAQYQQKINNYCEQYNQLTTTSHAVLYVVTRY